jgi:hypothetical protein
MSMVNPASYQLHSGTGGERGDGGEDDDDGETDDTDGDETRSDGDGTAGEDGVKDGEEAEWCDDMADEGRGGAFLEVSE